MSTHASIGYETEDGSYVGVYCQFDGYPSNIVPVLRVCLHQDVVDNVERALVEGGLCDVECWETYVDAYPTRNEESAREQWLETAWPCHANSYNYRVRLDGTIDCISGNGQVIDISAF